MTKPPAFQFYAKDWLSLRGLTFEQKGLYIDLLAIAWEDGGIPSDPEQIRGLVLISPRKFAALWPAIAAKWTPNGNGHLINPRLERQRAELEAWREKSRKGGRASAKARRLKGG